MAQGDAPGTGGAYTYLVGFTEGRSGPGGFQKEAALKLDLGGGRGGVGRGFLEDGRAGAVVSPRWPGRLEAGRASLAFTIWAQLGGGE